MNFDFALQKNFELYESHQLEFRAEFFNLFNHPNFGLPGGGFADCGGCSGWCGHHQYSDRQSPD